MGQMTVEQWYGTIKTGLTKKLTENKEALPAGFNQQRFILNCITVIQDMMKDDKKKAQLEKINPETIPVCLAKAAYLGLDFFNGECYAIPYGGNLTFQTDYKGEIKLCKRYSKRYFCKSSTAGRFLHGRGRWRQTECEVQTEAVFQ